jgi:predicted nucleic acid-binding protein
LPIVSNTSPLIWLSKIGKLVLLKKLFGEVIIPEEVYREAVEKGLQEGFSDTLAIKECIEQGWIKISKLNESEIKLYEKMMEHAFEIHLGEAQAIILARKINALLLMDESSGRAFAETLGLKVKGTLSVIMKTLREKLLDKAEAKEIVLTLVSKGFRIEPKLLARILREIDMHRLKHKR